MGKHKDSTYQIRRRQKQRTQRKKLKAEQKNKVSKGKPIVTNTQEADTKSIVSLPLFDSPLPTNHSDSDQTDNEHIDLPPFVEDHDKFSKQDCERTIHTTDVHGYSDVSKNSIKGSSESRVKDWVDCVRSQSLGKRKRKRNRFHPDLNVDPLYMNYVRFCKRKVIRQQLDDEVRLIYIIVR